MTAAFTDATLTSVTTLILNGRHSVIHAVHGDNCIVAPPTDLANPPLNANYTFYGGGGYDLSYPVMAT